MQKTIFILVLSFVIYSSLFAQNIKVYNFNEFEPELYRQSDSLYFVNFWATWCVPCIKEMPAITKIAEKYAGEKLKILLVSLDMPKQIESRLKPFIDKYNIKSEVILLDDPDFNSWIDKVDKSWGGGIPATLIYSKKTREFYERSFEFEELDNIINIKLNEL